MRYLGPHSDGIYLDYQGSTPIDPRVVKAMLAWWQRNAGNPYSGEHAFGSRAADAIDQARSQIAGLVSAERGEIFFTSSGTEANNLAISGALRGEKRKRRKLLVTAIEHTSVLGPAAALAMKSVLYCIRMRSKR